MPYTFSPRHSDCTNGEAIDFEGIEGVRVACQGELATGTEEVAPCKVPAHKCVVHEGMLSEVSDLIGMPLVVFRVCPELVNVNECSYYQKTLPPQHFDNTIADRLISDCSLEAADDQDSFESLFANQSAGHLFLGSVIVVREDRQPLLPCHVRRLDAFLDAINSSRGYADDGQSPTYAEAVCMDAVELPRTKSDAKADLTPGAFKEFYKNMKYDPASEWEEEDNQVIFGKCASPFEKFQNDGRYATTRMWKREAFLEADVEVKLQSCETWRELSLAKEIAKLKYRLGEGPEHLTIGKKMPLRSFRLRSDGMCQV